MTLPTGSEKEKMIRAGEKRVEEAKQKEQRLAAAVQEEVDRKFNERIAQIKRRIEFDITSAINRGQRETTIIIRNPDYNDRNLQAWHLAVADLTRSNPEYTFAIAAKILFCDNAGEAANVDGVTYKTWTENVHELKVTW
jgi:hypothetical protein